MCFKLAMYMRIIISLHIQPKILQKSHVSTSFSKKLILLIFTYTFNASKFLRASLWLHSDVIWSSMVLILLSIDREGPYLYTGSKYRGIRHIENSGRGLQQPPFLRMCYKRYLRKTRVNWTKVSFRKYFFLNKKIAVKHLMVLFVLVSMERGCP